MSSTIVVLEQAFKERSIVEKERNYHTIYCWEICMKSVIGYNSCLQLMQNRQNQDPNMSIYQYPSFILRGEADLEPENATLNVGPTENDPNLETTFRGGIIFDRLDFLAVDSLCTISRGSLDIAADAPSMEVNTNIQEEAPSTFKSSIKSLIFEEQERQEESEQQLVAKTEELSLGGQEEVGTDIFSGYSPKKHRVLMKTRPKIHHIKHAKQLIRELKREHKYSDRIIGDVVISIDNKTSKAKGATIEPIISEKGHLSGLIVSNGPSQFKIRVINQRNDCFDPRLELWDELEETWLEFQFKIKIRSA